ncbi:Lipoate-protein ligase LplJ [Sporotomaculum syntrophicum]|uniref:lipoate--protein ligase n=1 Tax=Sporotomaculum syntrophicum TaxID=182264 RepID=A0A9D2WP53_9FIRM|nr:lipoate--protein ligase [Sporotomaculum syntrophicum]KAF1085052.1 Lipoate-protein ligase LplJ [Sporotomaculum syntrophicum]
MLNIINNSNDPYFNLALEEYLIKQAALDDDKLILWQNAPAIVIGKHQNALAEINYHYVQENNIQVVRRLTGGGAVYHDPGNLNFTFLLNRDNFATTDFSVLAEPIIYCLSTLGVRAEFNGRNDICVDYKKFSGNAQYLYKNTLLHHGTILFDSDLTVLGQALKPKKKYISRAVRSVQSLVTNLKPYLPGGLNLPTFKQLLAESIIAYHNRPYQEYQLTAKDIQAVNRLVADKYSTWAWNFGSAPAFAYQKELTFAGGSLTLHFNISHGLITECKFYGDFFEQQTVQELEAILTGRHYEEAGLQSLLEKVDASQYIRGLTSEQLMSCLF